MDSIEPGGPAAMARSGRRDRLIIVSSSSRLLARFSPAVCHRLAIWHTAGEDPLNPNAPLAQVALVLAALAGCARPALSTHKTENPSIPYEVLFTRSGCEVGRFIDFGRPVYVTLCPAAGVSASQSSWVENCGKNCTHTVDRHQTQIRDEPSAPPPASP